MAGVVKDATTSTSYYSTKYCSTKKDYESTTELRCTITTLYRSISVNEVNKFYTSKYCSTTVERST
jgi:hypothetical protein